MAGKVSREHQLAVGEFLKRVVVPLIYELPDGRVDQVGTCTLLREQEHVFLITARHTFTDRNRDSFVIPENPLRGDFVRLSFEFLTLVDPPNQDIDLAVLKLTSAQAVQQLDVEWRFLTRANTAAASPQGTFLISGYPSSRAKIVGQAIGGSLNTIYTERMATTPTAAASPVDPGLDMFFHYDQDAEGLDGQPVSTPDLPGVSGSSIWEYSEVAEGLWTPERALKIVGVETSWRRGEYARGKAWRYVQHILDNLP